MNRTLAGQIVNRVLRSAIRNHREEMGNAWTAKDGSTLASDGFRAYKLTFAPIGVNATTAENKDPLHADAVRFYRQHVEKKIDECVHDRTYTRTDVPDAVIIKQKIEMMKDGTKESAHRALYRFGNGPYVNPQYLRDIVLLLPGAEWYATESPYKPVIAISPDGMAMLYPVRAFGR